MERTDSSTGIPEGCQFSMLTEQELLDFGHDPALELFESTIKDSIARGEICFGATLNGKLVAYDWRAFSAAILEKKHNIWVDFNPGNVYDRYSFTVPAYRGKHIIRPLWVYADDQCYKKGETNNLSFVDTDNFPPLRACKMAGYPVVGYAGYIHLFGKLFAFRTPGAEKYGFRFFKPVGERLP
ncbi:MAG: hypothetical protein O7G31_00650 [Calditrichaeota bacterium]|nr:hypothetical protein [Calditrichota bacterium]